LKRKLQRNKRERYSSSVGDGSDAPPWAAVGARKAWITSGIFCNCLDCLNAFDWCADLDRGRKRSNGKLSVRDCTVAEDVWLLYE
jgi:hypothetical protein